MYKSETKRTVRVAASAVITMALALGTTGVAFADGSHGGHSHHGYANEGRHHQLTGVVVSFAPGTAPVTGVFTITGHEGSSTRTVDITATTVITRGGTTILAAAVLPGSEIKATGTIDSSGVMTALSVRVNAPKMFTAGVVTAIDPTANTITIKGRDGVSGTFTTIPGTVLGSTTYAYDDNSTPVTSASVGERVKLQLSTTTPQTVVKVVIELASFEGKVTAPVSTSVTAPVTGAITITGHEGSLTRTVDITATTVFTQGGTTTTVASVLPGSEIKATGTIDSSGVMTALSVKISGGHSHSENH